MYSYLISEGVLTAEQTNSGFKAHPYYREKGCLQKLKNDRHVRNEIEI